MVIADKHVCNKHDMPCTSKLVWTFYDMNTHRNQFLNKKLCWCAHIELISDTHCCAVCRQQYMTRTRDR